MHELANYADDSTMYSSEKRKSIHLLIYETGFIKT